jgi:hypothetical protein
LVKLVPPMRSISAKREIFFTRCPVSGYDQVLGSNQPPIRKSDVNENSAP